MAGKYVDNGGAAVIASEIKKKYEKPADGIPASDLQSGILPHPTYFKLDGAPVADIGGVGTTYSIGIANLTPSSSAPTVGDVVIFRTGQFTYISSVTEVQVDEVLVQVQIAMLSESSGGGAQYYDTVIGSQADFEAWYAKLDAGTYTGSSVLLLSGKYTRSDGKGLHLPETLKQLHGLGTVQVSITDLAYDASSNKGGIWYDTTPTGSEYSIKNISVSCAISTSANASGCGFCNCTNLSSCTGWAKGNGFLAMSIGFFNCTNLTNCACSVQVYLCKRLTNCSGQFLNCTELTNCMSQYSYTSCDNLTNCSSSGDNAHFLSCNNLTNCILTCTSVGTGYGSSFDKCTNLVSCTGSVEGSSDNASNMYCFYQCANLVNCRGTSTCNNSAGYSYGFHSCTNLANCIGIGINTVNKGRAFGFSGCKMCSTCGGDSGVSAAGDVWGGTNTYISKDTCPEYVS